MTERTKDALDERYGNAKELSEYAHKLVFRVTDGRMSKLYEIDTVMSVVDEINNDIIERESRAAMPAPKHPDDAAVDAFAARMKEKLAKKRAEGYGGWEDQARCTDVRLSKILRLCVDKGDPVDVANLAMMLGMRGEGITPPPADAEREKALAVIRDMVSQYGGNTQFDAFKTIEAGLQSPAVTRAMVKTLRIIASGGEGEFQWSMTKAEKMARETIALIDGKEG